MGADRYDQGFADGLAQAAEVVEALWHDYSTPAARAALGAAMDRLRELAAEHRNRG